MAIKLNKTEEIFRNELIFAADAKSIKIDHTLVNLYMLLNFNGSRPRQRTRKGEKVFIDLERLESIFMKLEERNDNLIGFKEHPEAVGLWLRTNLVNLANRGNLEKEVVTSLRPIHLESYRVRNAYHTRDYFSADQAYLMLSVDEVVKEDLKKFLSEGWDKHTDSLVNSAELDVDSLGILHLIKEVSPGFFDSASTLNKVRPLLTKQAELYCDDVRRLLVYKTEIPRNVLIDYLKTITSFHLSLYLHKVMYLLPKMVEQGTVDVEDDWSIVIDTTDDFESKISKLAIADAERTYNGFYDYIKAGFKIKGIINRLKLSESDSDSIPKALYIIKNELPKHELRFEMIWDTIIGDLNEETRELVEEWVKYEDTYFDRYVELLMREKGSYQLRFSPEFVDSLSQKNTENGFLAQGRSKKHPRRYVMGTKLLEALVQMQVLELYQNEKFITESISIEQLLDNLRMRYGLIINGINEKRFEKADLQTHLAFKENIEAFKLKLRQIGFYNDLSDAYILQKIRPRYEIKP